LHKAGAHLSAGKTSLYVSEILRIADIRDADKALVAGG
jgi:hypothetical protein